MSDFLFFLSYVYLISRSPLLGAAMNDNADNNDHGDHGMTMNADNFANLIDSISFFFNV